MLISEERIHPKGRGWGKDKMAKEVSSLLGPDPRVPVGQWTAQAHMKDIDAHAHINLSHCIPRRATERVFGK